MGHIYNNEFFDYIDAGARSSARRLIHTVQPWLDTQSVVDMGSGRGVWLAQWQEAGVEDVLAIDGDYVDRDALAIPQNQFMAADLTKPVTLKRKFELAQSLEVGEHLPTSAAETLVDSLTKASDRVLFSAAVTGQGGEFHINEQPLSFWQDRLLSAAIVPLTASALVLQMIGRWNLGIVTIPYFTQIPMAALACPKRCRPPR